MATRKKVNKGLKRGMTKRRRVLRGGMERARIDELSGRDTLKLYKYLINTYFAPYFYMGDDKDKAIDPLDLHNKLTSKIFKNKILNARYGDEFHKSGLSNGLEVVIGFICFLIYYNKHEYTSNTYILDKNINSDKKIDIDDRHITGKWETRDRELDQFISINLPSASSKLTSMLNRFDFFIKAERDIHNDFFSIIKRYNADAIREHYGKLIEDYT